MYNRIILVGNLTKDPELRYSPQGTPIGVFRLAVSSKFKQTDDKDETLFIDIVTFGKLAEVCGQYISKGKSVLVEGRLRERSWEKDGQRHSRVEVIANTVRFLSKKQAAGPEAVPAAEDFGAPPEENTDVEPF